MAPGPLQDALAGSLKRTGRGRCRHRADRGGNPLLRVLVKAMTPTPPRTEARSALRRQIRSTTHKRWIKDQRFISADRLSASGARRMPYPGSSGAKRSISSVR